MALEPPTPNFDDPEEEFENERELTFEEICPVWSDRIRNWDQLTDVEQDFLKRLLLFDGSRCFLGEAWGWSSSWGRTVYGGAVCGMCRDFGEVSTPHSMVASFISFARLKEPDIKAELGLCKQIKVSEICLESFEQRKAKFVAHWNKYHRRFMGKRKVKC